MPKKLPPRLTVRPAYTEQDVHTIEGLERLAFLRGYRTQNPVNQGLSQYEVGFDQAVITSRQQWWREYTANKDLGHRVLIGQFNAGQHQSGLTLFSADIFQVSQGHRINRLYLAYAAFGQLALKDVLRELSDKLAQPANIVGLVCPEADIDQKEVESKTSMRMSARGFAIPPLGDANPDIQIPAIEYIDVSQGPIDLEQVSILSDSNDAA